MIFTFKDINKFIDIGNILVFSSSGMCTGNYQCQRVFWIYMEVVGDYLDKIKGAYPSLGTSWCFLFFTALLSIWRRCIAAVVGQNLLTRYITKIYDPNLKCAWWSMIAHWDSYIYHISSFLGKNWIISRMSKAWNSSRCKGDEERSCAHVLQRWPLDAADSSRSTFDQSLNVP